VSYAPVHSLRHRGLAVAATVTRHAKLRHTDACMPSIYVRDCIRYKNAQKLLYAVVALLSCNPM